MTIPTRTESTRRTSALLWLMPYIALAIFVFAMIALVWHLQRREAAQETNVLARDMQWAEQTMRLLLQADQEFLSQMAREVADGSLSEAQFQVRATQYLANNPAMTHILWVDPKHRIRWSAPYDATEWFAGETLAPEPDADDSERPTWSEARQTGDGKAILKLTIPIRPGQASLGVITGIYSVDAMLRHLVPIWFTDKYRISFTDAGNRVLAVNSTASPIDDGVNYATEISPPGHGFALRAVAYQTKSEAARLLPPALIIALSFVVAWSLWLLRRHVQQRIRVERERDQLFRLSLDILCIAGMDGSIRRTSPAFRTILGYADDALPAKLLDVIHADDQHIARNQISRLAAGQPVEHFEARCRTADGEYKWLSWSANPVAEERVFYAVAHDITEPKRLEEMRLTQLTRLQQTSRLITMGEMASSLAHELNQPLTAIANYCMGCVRRLEAGTSDHGKLLEGMRKASAQAERAGKIIHRMRDFVRRGEADLTPIQLRDLVVEAVGFARLEARRRMVRIATVIPDALPRIVADRIMIEQVIFNLLRNAIEAMENTALPERRLVIAASVQPDPACVVLTVTDRGSGIDPDDVERIFQPLYTTKADGMGMGLNICRSIAEIHDGRLWVTVNPAGGSIFHLALPMEKTG